MNEAIEVRAPANLEIRSAIVGLEQKMLAHLATTGEEQPPCPLKHVFAPGAYAREIFIPKHTLVVGKIHKHSHLNMLMKGKVSVLTEEGPKILEAPMTMVSPAGTKRVVFTHEDTVWTTVHLTNETDVEKIETEIIAKDYDELDQLAQQELIALLSVEVA
jgi:hypothetical protein